MTDTILIVLGSFVVYLIGFCVGRSTQGKRPLPGKIQVHPQPQPPKTIKLNVPKA